MVKIRDVETWKIHIEIKCGDLVPKSAKILKTMDGAPFTKFAYPELTWLRTCQCQ